MCEFLFRVRVPRVFSFLTVFWLKWIDRLPVANFIHASEYIIEVTDNILLLFCRERELKRQRVWFLSWWTLVPSDKMLCWVIVYLFISLTVLLGNFWPFPMWRLGYSITYIVVVTARWKTQFQHIVFVLSGFIGLEGGAWLLDRVWWGQNLLELLGGALIRIVLLWWEISWILLFIFIQIFAHFTKFYL